MGVRDFDDYSEGALALTMCSPPPPPPTTTTTTTVAELF